MKIPTHDTRSSRWQRLDLGERRAGPRGVLLGLAVHDVADNGVDVLAQGHVDEARAAVALVGPQLGLGLGRNVGVVGLVDVVLVAALDPATVGGGDDVLFRDTAVAGAVHGLRAEQRRQGPVLALEDVGADRGVLGGQLDALTSDVDEVEESVFVAGGGSGVVAVGQEGPEGRVSLACGHLARQVGLPVEMCKKVRQRRCWVCDLQDEGSLGPLASLPDGHHEAGVEQLLNHPGHLVGVEVIGGGTHEAVVQSRNEEVLGLGVVGREDIVDVGSLGGLPAVKDIAHHGTKRSVLNLGVLASVCRVWSATHSEGLKKGRHLRKHVVLSDGPTSEDTVTESGRQLRTPDLRDHLSSGLLDRLCKDDCALKSDT